MRRLFLTLFVFAFICSSVAFAAETRGLRVSAKDPATGQSGEVKLYNKSYAVIIGIDRYRNLPADRQLTYAVRDAEGVEAVLRKNYRFDKIITLYNQDATKERIMRLLTTELPRTIRKEDALFVFWAGHGNQESSPDGDIGYLIPHDGSTEEIYRNITMTEVRDTISKRIPAKHIFYAFDACYSGLLTTRAVDIKTRRDLSYLKEITKERVRQVLTAGDKGQEVLDGGPKGHSVFTGRLIEILEAQGDYITANEIQAIIREKVYGDASGRGHRQTPGYGRLSGSGDYVFVPSVEQKVADAKAEIAKMEAELKALENAEKSAAREQDEQKRKEAIRQKSILEARLKAEALRQQQLAQDQQRILREEAERKALLEQKKAEEERLVRLKVELNRKKQNATYNANTLEAAIAEIRQINKRINEIEAGFMPLKEQINKRYDTLKATLERQTKDEFESRAEFEQRITKEITANESKRKDEIAQLDENLAQETRPLRYLIKSLAEKEFTLEPATLKVELGRYDADGMQFPVSIRSVENNPIVRVNINAVISISREDAQRFKQAYQIGLVYPQTRVKAGNTGQLTYLAILNQGDKQLYHYEDGRFISAKVIEERILYTDPQTGLQWPRNGNIADKQMQWHEAIFWVKSLNYAGYSDWRLPTEEELESFAKKKREWFDANGFENISQYIWSSSIYENDTDRVWNVDPYTGKIYVDSKERRNGVWPVRGGKK